MAATEPVHLDSGEALGDERDAAVPHASAVVLRAVEGEPSGVPAFTVEVDLPPLRKPAAFDEDLAVRIDDVPVTATAVGFDSVGTSSIEIAPMATMELPPLDVRNSPYVRPIGERSTGSTPRLPTPNPRATGPLPMQRRPVGELDALLGTGPTAVRPLGGHVPGATGEVPRIDGSADGGAARRQSGAWNRLKNAATRRGDRQRDAG